MSILNSLGVRTVTIVPHNASGESKPSRFCACLAFAAATALSGTALAQDTPSAHASADSVSATCAEENAADDDDEGRLKVGKQVVENALSLNAVAGGPRLIRMSGTLLRSAINPLDLVADTAVGGAVGAATGDYKLGRLAGSNASALMLASAINPLAAGVLLVGAGRDTLAYIEQEKKASYDEALQDSLERICNIREKESTAIRLAERHSQNDWSPERQSAHAHYITGLIKDAAATGSPSKILTTYAQTEAVYAAAGGEPSPWLASYVTLHETFAGNSIEADQNQNQYAVSQHSTIKTSIASFEHSLSLAQNPSALAKLSQISSNITPEAVRSFKMQLEETPHQKPQRDGMSL